MKRLFLLALLGSSLFLVGCGSLKDQSLIATREIEVPDELRTSCRDEVAPMPDREVGEGEVLEFIASLLNTIDLCDRNKTILVDMIDQLNNKTPDPIGAPNGTVLPSDTRLSVDP